MNTNESRRAYDWNVFSRKVWQHIENYTVPQYGDRGEDQVSNYDARMCVEQVKKYAARFGKGSRPGEELRDIMKIAHYAQLAYDKLEAELKAANEPHPFDE